MLILDNISKTYGYTLILERVDLSLDKGEMLCLSGPSGIGKSTVLTLASGLETPDSGRVLNEFKTSGFAFQVPILLPWKSAVENMEFVLSGRVDNKGSSPGGQRDQIFYWLENLGLGPAADKRPDQLSGGMKKRLGLAVGLVTNPDLLFLDEPFTFLDSEWQKTIARFLLDLNRKNNTTIFMASHELAPVRQMGAQILCIQGSPIRLNHSS